MVDLPRHPSASGDAPASRKADDPSTLREALDRLDKIASLVPGVVYQYKRFPDGSSCFPYASEGIRDIYRVTPGQVREDASAVFAILHPDDLPAVAASIVASATTLEPWRLEYRVRFPDGEVRWLLGHANPARQPDGSVLWHGYISDVTERRRADEALRASEEKYRLLVENANEAIYVVQEGRICFANGICASLLGLSIEQLLGRHVLDFVPPEAREQAIDHHRRTLRGDRTPGLTEFPVRANDGRIGWAEVNAVRITWDGAPATLNFATDITERRRAQEERLDLERRFLHAQKLESLGVLAGGIAHDFNNLLMAILGNLDLAAEDLRGSPARHSVVEAWRAARRAADLTHQMLAYSGRGRFVLERIDLGTFVNENVHMLKAALSKTITLEVSGPSLLPPIRADRGQLQQVVMNLITNASEAVGQQPGRVSITTGVQTCSANDLAASRLEEKPPPGPFVYLEVADTGCGMDAATRERLFEPFFTTKFTGRGLGMAALLGILRGHGGAVFVDSEPQRGTRVRVLFPASTDETRQDAGTSPAAGTPARSAPAGAIGRLVLVVDDEASVRELCERTLRRMGYRTLAAADGVEALRLFEGRSEEIGAVILDLTMPNMDGVSTFSALRRIRADVRVILSSGYSEHETLRRFPQEGPAGFIQKPYELARLRDALERLLA